MVKLIDFSRAAFRPNIGKFDPSNQEATVLGSLVYRPMIFRRNKVGWIAA
jgi:hypothetical protein